MTPNELHIKALAASQHFQKAEVSLMQILEEMDLQRAYLPLGYPSLFKYVVEAIKLSEAQAFNIINVSRKSREVPQLREEIESGALSISKARKVVPVLTKENSKEWISKAVSMPQRELEREVARVNPELAKPREMIKRISEDRSRFQMAISDELLQKLRRSQTLLSQRRGKTLSLEETLEQLNDFYLNQKDPVVKAKRSETKGRNLVSQKAKLGDIGPSIEVSKQAVVRQPLTAALKHQINNRDHGKCAFISEEGRRCEGSSFVQIHHIQPVAKGGKNILNNLQSLCRSHHQFYHDIEASNLRR